MTKTRNYSAFASPRPVVMFEQIYADGHRVKFLKSQEAPVVRRVGEYAKITSKSGIDGRMRPCYHERHLYTLSSSPLATVYKWVADDWPPGNPFSSSTVNQANVYNLDYDVHAQFYNGFITQVNAMSVNLSATQWDSLAQTAISKMLPSFHSDNSLINFVLEFKDFKNVMEYLRNKLYQQFSALEAFLGVSRRNKPLKNISNAYLSYSFGWAPLYKDLVSFVKTALAFQSRYDELMQRAYVPQQSYYGTWVSGTAASESIITLSSGAGATGGGLGAGSFRTRARARLGDTQGVRYHATIRYRYAPPVELRSLVGKLKAYLDMLGVSLNPSTLWNAIPFSFIVDWIANVSGFLNTIRVDNIDFKTEILDFCHSGKIERTVFYELAGFDRIRKDGTNSLHPFETTDSCKKIVYERRLGLPNWLLAMQTSGLDYREFSLAGALLGARVDRRLSRINTRINTQVWSQPLH